MAQPRIALVLSDIFLFQEGIKSLLDCEELCYEVLFFDNSKEFEETLQKHSPNVILLDLQSTAFRAEKVLAFVDFTTRSNIVLFAVDLSPKECDAYVSMGAKGVMSKKSSKEVLVDGFIKVDQNNVFVDKAVCRLLKGDSSMIEQLKISKREKEIIKLIAQGLINKEIADQLFISTHTVNTHRKNIMAKLNINNTAGIVLFAVKEGIVSPNEFLFN
jgi:DNA-binding NarL/FixJ family response regulator